MRRLWIVLLALVVAVVATSVAERDWFFATVYGVVGLALVRWVAPWRGGRTTTHQEVLAMPESEKPVVIYWRPGCGFCQRLKGHLGKDGERATWVNIWQDDEAAAGPQQVERSGQALLECVELFVDRDAQGLEDARGRVGPARLAWVGR